MTPDERLTALLGEHRCRDVHGDRWDWKYGTGTCRSCESWGAHVAAVLTDAGLAWRDEAQAEVANAYVQWAMKNEIAGEGPLEWEWFGEISRRYSPLHEQYNRAEHLGGGDRG